MEMKNHRSAFTLIELLVVVVIIAILAAIALPNFLDAQARAKAARARADIRTIVTALETYRVDHNGYPSYHYSSSSSPLLEFHIGGVVPSFGVPDPNWKGRNPLTTPVAYVTKFPDDPFSSHNWGGPDEMREYLYVNWDYAVTRIIGSGWENIFAYARRNYGPYRIHSRGPDGDGPDSGTPYDPTNGTRSDGDITYGPNTGYDHFVPFPPS